MPLVQQKSRTTLRSQEVGVIAALAVVNFGRLNLQGFARTQGTWFQDVPAASVVLEYRAAALGPVLFTFPVPLNGTQPASTYTWDEPVHAPYVTLVVTNGGAPTAASRIFHEAIP